MKIAKEGYTILLTIAIAMVFSFLFNIKFLAVILLILLLFSLYFFRDPKRFRPLSENFIVSPADGKVIEIKKLFSEKLQEESYKISIFMSVFDVHFNRLPYRGVILKKDYRKGKFFNASLDKASEDNEKMIYYVDSTKFKYTVTQIAGLIARRIVSYPNSGEELNTSDKLGIIKFGSRAEIEIPQNIIDINISVGQQVYAGESIIGSIKGSLL